MTHGFRSRFLLAGGIALATASLLGSTAVAASAGVTPTPSPLVTPAPTSSPHHHVRPHLRPEQFDITITLNTSDVEAFGPVAAHLGTDQTVSPFRDIFSDGAGDTVNVDHARLPLPEIDLATCSLLFVQRDAPWRFDGGTGIWTGATGHGIFNLVGLVSFKEYGGRCRTLQFVSPGRALWDIEHSTGLPAPVIADFDVQAAGLAAVQPCVTLNHFAPTLSAKYGGVPSPSPLGDCPTPQPTYVG
jgi:hypothetical protein